MFWVVNKYIKNISNNESVKSNVKLHSSKMTALPVENSGSQHSWYCDSFSTAPHVAVILKQNIIALLLI